MPELNGQTIQAILLDCLYKTEEVGDATTPPEGSVFVEGITLKMAFHPGRLESHREEVRALIAELPDNWKEGRSFLEMCYDRHERQWTGAHRSMEELTLLGVGLKLMSFCAPREFWPMLPAGLPYIQVVA